MKPCGEVARAGDSQTSTEVRRWAGKSAGPLAAGPAASPGARRGRWLALSYRGGRRGHGGRNLTTAKAPTQRIASRRLRTTRQSSERRWGWSLVAASGVYAVCARCVRGVAGSDEGGLPLRRVETGVSTSPLATAPTLAARPAGADGQGASARAYCCRHAVAGARAQELGSGSWHLAAKARWTRPAGAASERCERRRLGARGRKGQQPKGQQPKGQQPKGQQPPERGSVVGRRGPS
jgi:hypothetical protein